MGSTMRLWALALVVAVAVAEQTITENCSWAKWQVESES